VSPCSLTVTSSTIRAGPTKALVPGSTLVDLSAERQIAPGPAPDSFVYTRTVSHWNLFRIQLP
jgi:hypothetical protein